MDNNQEGNKAPTAFLVDLVSNRKIPIATPRCRVGRDDLNDIVISGDQSISRFHFIISYENGEFTVQDAKSRHGTFLNGNQLTVSEPIKDGDVLKVGVSLFWFVVEGAQSETADAAGGPGKVNAINDTNPGQATGMKPGDKSAAGAGTSTSTDLEATMMPTNMDLTQEFAKPDAGLMDKLEKAANAKKDERPAETKTSLAALLADAREPEPDKKKEELAALAARDKELLQEMEEESPAAESDKEKSEAVAETPPAEKSEEAEKPAEEAPAEAKSDTVEAAENKEPADAEKDEKPAEAATESVPETAEEEKKEEVVAESEKAKDEFPPRPVNKPSDTVTLEALQPPSAKTAEEQNQEKAPEPKASESNEVQASAADEPENKAEESDSKSANLETKSENAEIIEASGDHENKSVVEAEEKSTAEAADSQTASQSDVAESPKAETDNESAPHSGTSGSNGSGSYSGEKLEDIGQAIGRSNGSSESPDLEVSKYIKAGASVVPDWCKRYFSDEIAKLNSELDELNEQVRQAQQKIRDVESRVALTRGIRNTLLTTTGDELVEACGKVLSLLGWKVTISTEDKHELRLEVEDKHVCIARVIWTTTKAERSHLGQLSISQTRYWMEKGVEPKGIIIVSKISGEPPTAVGDSPEEMELNDYAAKRNVCLMSTLQLLSLYKEIALADASPDKLRTSIVNASGWLSGHNLEPGTAEVAEDDSNNNQSANKLSSLLSA